jgi:hypothetical protein
MAYHTRKSLSAFGWTFENRVSFHAVILTIRLEKATGVFHNCGFWLGLGLALLRFGGRDLNFIRTAIKIRLGLHGLGIPLL